jgi:hypothetical protein
MTVEIVRQGIVGNIFPIFLLIDFNGLEHFLRKYTQDLFSETAATQSRSTPISCVHTSPTNDPQTYSQGKP